MKKRKRKFLNIRKRGFTDKLYFLNFCITWIFAFVCVLITLLSGTVGITDLSVVSIGLPVAFGELGLHTGLIVWKAKAENLNKYGQTENINM